MEENWGFIVLCPKIRQLLDYILEQDADADFQDTSGFTIAHYLVVLQEFRLLEKILSKMQYNCLTIANESVEDFVRYYFDFNEIGDRLKRLLRNLSKKPIRKKILDSSSLTSIVADSVAMKAYFAFPKYFPAIDQYAYTEELPIPFKEKFLLERLKEDLRSWNGSLNDFLAIGRRYRIGNFHVSDHCSEEHCQIGRSIYKIMEKIAAMIHLPTDHTSQFQIIPVGSFVDGSRLFLPDEFDFLLVFPDESVFSNVKENIGYCQEFFGDTIKILAHSQYPLDHGLQFRHLACSRGALNYKIYFVWKGDKYPHLNITVDLIPVIRRTWNEKHPDLLAESELKSLLLNSSSLEYYITIDSSISIPTIECHLLSSRGPVTQECHGLLKLLFHFFCVNSGLDEGTYIVKMAFLNYCQIHGFPRDSLDLLPFIRNIIEEILLEQETIPRFGFVTGNETIENWCFEAVQNGTFSEEFWNFMNKLTKVSIPKEKKRKFK